MATGDEKLDRVESELGIRLPEFYCRFIQRRGTQIEALDEKWAEQWVAENASPGSQVSGPSPNPMRALPFTEPAALVYYNRLVRAEPIGRDEVPWPDEYFVVGVHFCQDYWCIKLDGTDQHVWNCWADRGKFEKGYESLESLLDSLQSDEDALGD